MYQLPQLACTAPSFQVSFEHFLWLADGYANPEGASFYLQKHAMHKWARRGLQVRPRPTTSTSKTRGSLCPRTAVPPTAVPTSSSQPTFRPFRPIHAPYASHWPLPLLCTNIAACLRANVAAHDCGAGGATAAPSRAHRALFAAEQRAALALAAVRRRPAAL